MGEERRVVIFDCDGVMFDSRKANTKFYNQLLSAFGHPPLDEVQLEFVHMHTVDAAIEYLFEGSPHLEAARTYRSQMDYTPFIRDMIPEPALKEVLETLRPEFGLAVATNRSNTIDQVLEVHGLASYFDIVVSSLDVEHPKPDPEALFKVLRFFKEGPENAFYVGDSPVDHQTARAAGVPFVSYRNPEIEADYYINDLKELIVLVR